MNNNNFALKLKGTPGNDTLKGGKGNDLIDVSLPGGGGRDRVFGRAGNDTLIGDFNNTKQYESYNR